MDTATPTKQNVTDRELDPTKPQSTGNDKFKTQLSTETLTLVTINIEGFHGISPNFSKQGRYPSFTRTLATHI